MMLRTREYTSRAWWISSHAIDFPLDDVIVNPINDVEDTDVVFYVLSASDVVNASNVPIALAILVASDDSIAFDVQVACDVLVAFDNQIACDIPIDSIDLIAYDVPITSIDLIACDV